MNLTEYDYFALLPALIAAATPSIIGLKQKRSDRDDKAYLTLPKKDDDDVSNSDKNPSKKDDDLVS